MIYNQWDYLNLLDLLFIICSLINYLQFLFSWRFSRHLNLDIINCVSLRHINVYVYVPCTDSHGIESTTYVNLFAIGSMYILINIIYVDF